MDPGFIIPHSAVRVSPGTRATSANKKYGSSVQRRWRLTLGRVCFRRSELVRVFCNSAQAGSGKRFFDPSYLNVRVNGKRAGACYCTTHVFFFFFGCLLPTDAECEIQITDSIAFWNLHDNRVKFGINAKNKCSLCAAGCLCASVRCFCGLQHLEL